MVTSVCSYECNQNIRLQTSLSIHDLTLSSLSLHTKRLIDLKYLDDTISDM